MSLFNSHNGSQNAPQVEYLRSKFEKFIWGGAKSPSPVGGEAPSLVEGEPPLHTYPALDLGPSHLLILYSPLPGPAGGLPSPDP